MLRKARDELIRKLNHLQSLLQVIKKPPDDKIFNLKSPDLQILKSLITLHLLLITVTTFSCSERVTPPDIPPYIPPILLAVEDTSCTDAFIRIKTTKAFDGGVLQLRREGSTKVEITNLNSQLDTLVIDEGLLPKREYKYRAYRVVNSVAVDSSMELIVRTMDTTSSAWQWAIDTLGEMNSYLVDCAIINDTLAYAVGEIYKRDSLGNWDPNAYNAVKWNGRTWQLKRIPFIGPCSAVDYPPLTAIWAFSERNILVTNGGSVVRYDGRNAALDCGMNSLLAGSINKIYATSPQDVYLVGNAGTIAHYDGVRWRRIESGTSGTIQDIFGGVDWRTGERVILCAVSAAYSIGGQRILRIRGNNAVDTIAWVAGRRPRSVWFQHTSSVFTCGDGVFRSNPDGSWREVAGINVIPAFTERVRGVNAQDVFVVGDFGVVAHFNGVNFRLYPEVAAALYYSCDYKPHRMVAVGERSGRAIIVRMWR